MIFLKLSFNSNGFIRTHRLKSFVLIWIVPEHSVSSVLTLNVLGSKGSLKEKIISALRFTLLVLFEGSTETSSGNFREFVSGVSSPTTAASRHPNKKIVKLKITKITDTEKLWLKFKK